MACVEDVAAANPGDAAGNAGTETAQARAAGVGRV